MDRSTWVRRGGFVALGVMAGLVGACVQMPTGPSVAVMPPPGKPLEVFSAEDQDCRAYSSQSVGANGQDVATSNVVGGAAIGTVVGAAAGALLGGHNGAGAGAGLGLVAGTAIGGQQAAYAGASMQQRYDIAYQQCMYAKGNTLPSHAYYWRRGYGYVYAAPPAPVAPPAPPPPPPPPPPPQ